MPTGSYDPYHLGDTGHTSTTQGVNSYLGTWNSDSTNLGWFPQTQADVRAMWNDKIGITCVECFFYVSHFNSSGMRYQFAADIRDRPGGATWCLYQVRLTEANANGDNGLRARFRYVLGNSTNGTSGGDIKLEVWGVQDWINTDEWYHSILRYNGLEWEWLVGRLGKNSDGTDAGGTVDNLNNDFWGPNESLNNHEPGSYHRMIQSQTDSGPLVLFGRSTNLSTSPNDGLRGFIGTQQGSNSDNRRNRSWPGGHCEHRFWKSGMDSARTYGQLENLKNTDVDGDQHSDLVHCFRLNETGASLSVSDFVDVGTLDGTFEAAVSQINSGSPDSGYPYGIATGVKEHEVSATIVGMARTYEFYGEEFGVDMDGNPAYRDKLFTNDRTVQQLQNETLDALMGVEGNPVGFRFAVEDYYNGKTYLLPGIGYVSEEPADVGEGIDADWYINLTSFVCNAGKDVVYSRYWLINAQVLELDNNIQYYASPPNGPHHIVQHETGKIFFGVNLD